jgi:hypothetical protein
MRAGLDVANPGVERRAEPKVQQQENELKTASEDL